MEAMDETIHLKMIIRILTGFFWSQMAVDTRDGSRFNLFC